MNSKIKDLRTFIEVLKENKQIEFIEKEVDWKYEIGSVLGTLEKYNKGAGYFRKVKDRDFPVCGGILSSMDRIALALGCTKEGIKDFLEACLKNPLKPEIITNAPCQENVIMSENIDLEKLPIPIHALKDGGPYITSGIVYSKELNGKKQNISYHRMQVKSKDKLTIFINEWRHLRGFHEEAEKQAQPLPIAVVIGADPAIYIAAGLRYDGDETEVAGAMRGSATQVVKCITSDIYIPATAEFVIEAEIVPEYREIEGPLGEFTGHYSQQWMNPILKINAITHRNDAIYQTLNGASFEHITVGNVVPREPLLKNFVKHVSSGVIDVHIPPYGSGFLAVIKIKKKNPGEPKNVALAAMISYVNIKNVIVVDEDVDIYNSADLMWAVCNRVVPERDIFFIPNSQGHELDPCADQRGVTTKMGIDATLSEDSRGTERVLYNEVDLKEYL
jgi:2,5-furandicarboxylate decarboxylase 1